MGSFCAHHQQQSPKSAGCFRLSWLHDGRRELGRTRASRRHAASQVRLKRLTTAAHLVILVGALLQFGHGLDVQTEEVGPMAPVGQRAVLQVGVRGEQFDVGCCLSS